MILQTSVSNKEFNFYGCWYRYLWIMFVLKLSTRLNWYWGILKVTITSSLSIFTEDPNKWKDGKRWNIRGKPWNQRNDGRSDVFRFDEKFLWSIHRVVCLCLSTRGQCCSVREHLTPLRHRGFWDWCWWWWCSDVKRTWAKNNIYNNIITCNWGFCTCVYILQKVIIFQTNTIYISTSHMSSLKPPETRFLLLLQVSLCCFTFVNERLSGLNRDLVEDVLFRLIL